MKNLLFFLIALCLIFSCSEPNEYNKFYSENIDYIVPIPDHYIEMNPTDYLFKTLDSDLDNKLIETNNGGIYNLLNSDLSFDLLYDTTNLNNNLIIYEGEYINLSTGIGSAYLKLVEENHLANWGSFGIEYNKIQSKYVHHKRTEYLKIKYDKISNGQKCYFTQYIISSNNRTISVVLNKVDTQDFEEIFKTIDLKEYLDTKLMKKILSTEE